MNKEKELNSDVEKKKIRSGKAGAAPGPDEESG